MLRMLALAALAWVVLLAGAAGARAAAPAVNVTETGGFTSIAEPATTDTYRISLTTAPTADVVITMIDNGQMVPSPSVVTFTPLNWSTPVYVTLTPVDDGVAEGVHTGMVMHFVDSLDWDYMSYPMSDIFATITDDDVVGVDVVQTGGSTAVAEGGATDSFQVQLTSASSSPVTITLSTIGGVTLTPGVLTFPAGQWKVPQQVDVAAIDDNSVEGLHAAVIAVAVASADSDYGGMSVPSMSVSIADNDAGGLVYGSGSMPVVSIVENGGSGSFGVRLSAQPSATVTVTPSVGEGLALDDAMPLTFTAAGWNVPQQVSVHAVNDNIAKGLREDGVTFGVASTDPAFNNVVLNPAVVAVVDDDAAGLVTTGTTETNVASESGSCVDVTLKLTSQPTATVSVSMNPDEQVSTDISSIDLDADTWNTGAPVHVCATDDEATEGSHTGSISFSLWSTDGSYALLSVPELVVSIIDNDTPEIRVGADQLTVVEGAPPVSLTVELGSRPDDEVTVDVTSDSVAQSQVTTLTFTPEDWSTPQEIPVTTGNDSIAQSMRQGMLSLASASADAKYVGLGAIVSVTVIDDDIAGIEIREEGTSTQVAEGGGTDTYELRLTSQPTDAVTIVPLGGSQLSASPVSVSFTADDWNVWKTVAIGAINDLDVEGNATASVPHEIVSDDAIYQAVITPTLAVQVIDDDKGTLQLKHEVGSTEVAESGLTDTVSVALGEKPPDGTTVTVSFESSGQLTASPDTLTFTEANWNTNQPVTVGAVEDHVDEPDSYSATLTAKAASASSSYDGVVATLNALVLDNDAAGIRVVEVGGATKVSESGISDKITVALATEPVSNVTLNIAPDAQLKVSKPKVTFTTATWNTAQTVTITAVQDRIAEGDHTGLLAFSFTTEDAAYKTISVAGISAAIVDDDKAGNGNIGIGGDGEGTDDSGGGGGGGRSGGGGSTKSRGGGSSSGAGSTSQSSTSTSTTTSASRGGSSSKSSQSAKRQSGKAAAAAGGTGVAAAASDDGSDKQAGDKGKSAGRKDSKKKGPTFMAKLAGSIKQPPVLMMLAGIPLLGLGLLGTLLSKGGAAGAGAAGAATGAKSAQAAKKAQQKQRQAEKKARQKEQQAAKKERQKQQQAAKKERQAQKSGRAPGKPAVEEDEAAVGRDGGRAVDAEAAGGQEPARERRFRRSKKQESPDAGEAAEAREPARRSLPEAEGEPAEPQEKQKRLRRPKRLRKAGPGGDSAGGESPEVDDVAA